MAQKTAYLAYDYARFYDWIYEGINDDIDFYLSAAKECGSPILELACGTGRITIPLAQAGFDVIGLDLSPKMLDIARKKLDREAPEVRERVRLLQGDMSDFDLSEKVNLAFIPCSSLFHLHTKEQHTSCLACIHRCLNPGGRVIIDLTAAKRMANQTVGELKEFKKSLSRASGKMTRELGKKLSIDKQAQCVTVEHTYIEAEPTGVEKRFVFIDNYTWQTEEQMRELLQQAGFDRIEVYGDYARQPFRDESFRMICVARK